MIYREFYSQDIAEVELVILLSVIYNSLHNVEFVAGPDGVELPKNHTLIESFGNEVVI